jgi:hypothetical protein
MTCICLNCPDDCPGGHAYYGPLPLGVREVHPWRCSDCLARWDLHASGSRATRKGPATGSRSPAMSGRAGSTR